MLTRAYSLHRKIKTNCWYKKFESYLCLLGPRKIREGASHSPQSGASHHSSKAIILAESPDYLLPATKLEAPSIALQENETTLYACISSRPARLSLALSVIKMTANLPDFIYPTYFILLSSNLGQICPLYGPGSDWPPYSALCYFSPCQRGQMAC